MPYPQTRHHGRHFCKYSTCRQSRSFRTDIPGCTARPPSCRRFLFVVLARRIWSTTGFLRRFPAHGAPHRPALYYCRRIVFPRSVHRQKAETHFPVFFQRNWHHCSNSLFCRDFCGSLRPVGLCTYSRPSTSYVRRSSPGSWCCSIGPRVPCLPARFFLPVGFAQLHSAPPHNYGTQQQIPLPCRFHSL